MKTAVLTALIAATVVVPASPAASLSCEELEPFDMAAAIAGADAAAVGTITHIRTDDPTEWGDAHLTLTVEISEVYKGRFAPTVVIERETSVWGPHYEVGQELALLVTGGDIDDGANSLCGPFYSPSDMRAAGGEPTSPGWMGWLLRILHGLLRAL